MKINKVQTANLILQKQYQTTNSADMSCVKCLQISNDRDIKNSQISSNFNPSKRLILQFCK